MGSRLGQVLSAEGWAAMFGDWTEMVDNPGDPTALRSPTVREAGLRHIQAVANQLGVDLTALNEADLDENEASMD